MAIKDDIRRHFDLLTPYYRQLWGEHIHHGYWRDGNESREVAQLQLIDQLVRRVGLEPGSRILDVGCGIGATAAYLAQKYRAEVTGITISPLQVSHARELAQAKRVDADFFEMDGEAITLESEFDLIWTVEVIAHYLDKENFFRHAARLCRPGGRVAMAVWLKAEHLSPAEEKRYITPIEKGMLLPGLCTLHQYLDYLYHYRFRVLSVEDVSPQVEKTWTLCLDIIKQPALWQLAQRHGPQAVHFLKAFRAMQAGYRSRSFVYALIAAEKTHT